MTSTSTALAASEKKQNNMITFGLGKLCYRLSMDVSQLS